MPELHDTPTPQVPGPGRASHLWKASKRALTGRRRIEDDERRLHSFRATFRGRMRRAKLPSSLRVSSE